MTEETLMKTLHPATFLFAFPLHAFHDEARVLNVTSGQPHEALHHCREHGSAVMMSKDIHPVSLAGQEQ
jgi:hypothetical protein